MFLESMNFKWAKNYILAIDQGTTSTRAIVFDQKLQPLATAQEEFTQHFPHSGWVEHDPEDLWSTTAAMCSQALEREHINAGDIAAIGITNQRAIYNAIVWQDRRTADYCQKLKEGGHEPDVTRKTGLLLDPYFSATKLNWILENVEGARTLAAEAVIFCLELLTVISSGGLQTGLVCNRRNQCRTYHDVQHLRGVLG